MTPLVVARDLRRDYRMGEEWVRAVRGGVRDILLSNEVVGTHKLRRLAPLAHEASVALCFDAPEQVAATSRIAAEMGVTLGGLVEIEVGMQRCGVATTTAACELARHIADAPSGCSALSGQAPGSD